MSRQPLALITPPMPEKKGEKPVRIARHSTFTFGITHDYIERFLQLENLNRKTGGAYSFQGAVLSLWLDLDKGREKSRRDYARVWGWDKSRVHRQWPEILQEIKDLQGSFGRSKSETPLRHPRDTRETENGDSESESKGSETPLRHPRDTRETLTNTALQTYNSTEEIHTTSAEPPKKRERKRKPELIHPDAEGIYKLYPRKVKKPEALLAITKAINGGRGPTELRTAVMAFAAGWEERLKYEPDAGQYIPHPSTWFNQARYDDDPNEWQYVPKTQVKGNGSHTQSTPGNGKPQSSYERRMGWSARAVAESRRKLIEKTTAYVGDQPVRGEEPPPD